MRIRKTRKTSSARKPSTLTAREFDVLNEKLDFLVQRVAMGSELSELKKEVKEMEKKWEERFKLILEAFDKQSRLLTDMQMVNTGAAMQLSRHEEWIKLIAKKAGVKLPA
ncbi:hypothetical protein HY968_01080 [Candidatus Kaiserbacteria bacterium]|nr:hypothetical protein [Candidatus Kaiserbacteria bacterium]